MPSQQNGGAVGGSGATSMVTATVVETNADQSAAIVGGDCTAGMHARDCPDTGTAGTAGTAGTVDQNTAGMSGADAVQSRPDTDTAGRSPGGRTRLGSEEKRDEVVVVVVARCGDQG